MFTSESVSVKWRKIRNIGLINMENSRLGSGWEGHSTVCCSALTKPSISAIIISFTVPPSMVLSTLSGRKYSFLSSPLLHCTVCVFAALEDDGVTQ